MEKKNKIYKSLKVVSIILAAIVLVLAGLTIARKIKYRNYPEFNQKVFALLDKYFVSHNKEIVLDFREENTETIADDNDDNFISIEFEHTYKIDGTNVIVKTSAFTDEYGMAQSDGPTEKEILERLEEYLESYR